MISFSNPPLLALALLIFAQKVTAQQSGEVYSIGNGVTAPAPLRQVPAGYSDLGRKLHAQGSVIVNFVVEPDGTATDAQVIRSIGYGLDERALASVQTWRFTPGAKDGRPVRVRINGEIRFPGVAAAWCSGPIVFESQPGMTLPTVMDGDMPPSSLDAARAQQNERAAFAFKVDRSGAVTDIRSTFGSQPAVAMLTPYLAKWKFAPATQNGHPVEAAATLNFQMGPLPKTISQAQPPAPQIAPLVAGSESVSGTLRRLEARDLLLQTASGKLLRFRLTLKTEFHDAGGRLYRDSLLSPGDRVTVRADRDDVETAVYVIFNRPGTDSDRQAASAPVLDSQVASPQPSDFSFASVPRPVESFPQTPAQSQSHPAGISPVVIDLPGVGSPPADSTAGPFKIGPIPAMTLGKDGQPYVWIRPGTFTMGCSKGDRECGDNEKPPHTGQISQGFWLARFEVTQTAYKAVIGASPSSHPGNGLAVENVSWEEARHFCEVIGGRLPTEAEWEYAARAGSAGPRYGNLDDVAWYAGNTGGRIPPPYPQKKPNAFGLYNMLGNLWEWVADSYLDAGQKVVRGGSRTTKPALVRASYRKGVAPSERSADLGFRCAGDWPPLEPSNPVEEDFKGRVRNVGGPVTPPQIVYKVEPEYSEEARQGKISGKVMVSMIVDTEGRARNIKVVQSLGSGLDEKAAESLRLWRFIPGSRDGQPVPVKATIEVNFRLL